MKQVGEACLLITNFIYLKQFLIYGCLNGTKRTKLSLCLSLPMRRLIQPLQIQLNEFN